MGVCLSGEDTQDIIVLVDGLAVVAALLLVPPVGVRVTELALDRGRVGVLSVLTVVSMAAWEQESWNVAVPFLDPRQKHRRDRRSRGGPV